MTERKEEEVVEAERKPLPWEIAYNERIELIRGLKISWKRDTKKATLTFHGHPKMIEQLVFYPQPKTGDFIAFVVTNYYLKNVQWSMKDRVKPIPVEEGQTRLTT